MQSVLQSFIVFENPLGAYPLAFPIIECFHIAGFALTVGTIALVDFRMLNLAMLHQTPSELSKDTSLWTLGGLILVIFSGLLLYTGDPDQYYDNLAFLLKMACLMFAIVFHYTVQRKAVLSGASPGKSKLVACLSLASWAAVIFGAIFIGFGPNVKL